MLNNTGFILIEVPVLQMPDKWPPGYFSLEHLNYFSQQSLSNLLDKCGLKALCKFTITTDNILYPVITCLAASKNNDNNKYKFKSDYERVSSLCDAYLNKENEVWKNIDNYLSDALAKYSKIVIWGAGIHTAQLFSRTNILKTKKIKFVVDSDPQKWESMIGNYLVKSPDKIRYDDESLVIVISSYASEEEIFKSIINRNDLKARVLRLYANNK